MKPVKIQHSIESRFRVFRRWSRHGFAAFASMNKEIKISNMNVSYNLLNCSGIQVTPDSFEKKGNCRESSEEWEELPLLENRMQQFLSNGIAVPSYSNQGHKKNFSDRFFFTASDCLKHSLLYHPNICHKRQRTNFRRLIHKHLSPPPQGFKTALAIS